MEPDIMTMHPVSVVAVCLALVGVLWALVYAMVKIMNGPNIVIHIDGDKGEKLSREDAERLLSEPGQIRE